MNHRNARRIELALDKERYDAQVSQQKIKTLAHVSADSPIDRITLELAATFCHTAARHLTQARDILRDYAAETEKADTP